MNTSKSLDYFGNKKFKKDWDELDHILAARHYKRKAEVRAEILAWHKAELAKERQAIVEAVEGLIGEDIDVKPLMPLQGIAQRAAGQNQEKWRMRKAIKEWQ